MTQNPPTRRRTPAKKVPPPLVKPPRFDPQPKTRVRLKDNPTTCPAPSSCPTTGWTRCCSGVWTSPTRRWSPGRSTARRPTAGSAPVSWSRLTPPRRSPPMRPRDALQMQADLRTALLNPDWADTTDWMLASMDVQRTYRDPLASDLHDDRHRQMVRAYVQAREDKGLPSLGQMFVERERRTLGLALTYVVAAHMEGLVRMAAADWPEDMQIEPDMLP